MESALVACRKCRQLVEDHYEHLEAEPGENLDDILQELNNSMEALVESIDDFNNSSDCQAGADRDAELSNHNQLAHRATLYFKDMVREPTARLAGHLLPTTPDLHTEDEKVQNTVVTNGNVNDSYDDRPRATGSAMPSSATSEVAHNAIPSIDAKEDHPSNKGS